MPWPTDDLTKTHLDAGTDSPANARAEIEAAIDKLKSVLAEVTTGATVWHSGNDGAASGLDADLLDGQQSSFYQDASNINAGSLNNARLNMGAGNGIDSDLLDGQHGSHYLDLANATGSLPGSQIISDTIGQDQISPSAIGQSEVKTASAEGSDTYSSTSPAVIHLNYGEYCFSPEARFTGHPNHQIHMGSDASYGGVRVFATMTGQGGGTLFVRSRYIQASPPHKIGQVDYHDFIYILLDENGDVAGTSSADDPPWYYVGPNSVKPMRFRNGKKYRDELILPSNFKSMPRKLQMLAKAKAKKREIEITTEYKNRDMKLTPHPFGKLKEGQQVILVEPDDKVYADLCELRSQGESVAEIIHEGYLKIADSKIKDRPRNVLCKKLRWKQ